MREEHIVWEANTCGTELPSTRRCQACGFSAYQLNEDVWSRMYTPTMVITTLTKRLVDLAQSDFMNGKPPWTDRSRPMVYKQGKGNQEVPAKKQ